ncbi:MAG: M14 family metallopeptidase [Gemmatimonadetes bacterium]|nr:M14 family metallopeptidase [Gemmatimonadota bacterium]
MLQIERRAALRPLVGMFAVLLTTPAVALAQGRYLDHAGLTAELRAIASASAAVSLSSIGTTIEGREIWVLELADPGGAPPADRPAVLVVGNLAGDHLVGSSHAIEIARYLTAGGDEARAVLADQAVYIVPRLNPDGAERMFESVRAGRRGNARPFDDDNDGRIDEDGPDDLNGDGYITVMRVPDANGTYMIDPDDPRLMKKADPRAGESGTHTIYWEGVDANGDGFIAEDGPGGVDLDRNFQHAYPYYAAHAGPHMVSENESRALMDFVIAHRNIGAILTFGHTDNLVTAPSASGELADPATLDLVSYAGVPNEEALERGVYPRSSRGGFGFGFGFGGGAGELRGAQPGRDNDPESGRRPSTTVHGDDIEYFKAASEAYREITGIERVGVNREAEGAFFQYGYFQFGVPSFSTQGWALPETDDEEEAPGGSGDRSFDARLLAGLGGAGIEVFAPWTTYAHPTLGDVEIGGFLPYVTRNPPATELAELERRHGEFVVRLAGMLPRVRIVGTEVTSHDGDVFTVEVEIENAGYLPTSLQHGVVSRAVQPTTVQIQIDPGDVITGGTKTMQIRQLAGSGSRERFTWVIRGRAGSQVEIRVRSQKGGSDSATVTLR